MRLVRRRRASARCARRRSSTTTPTPTSATSRRWRRRPCAGTAPSGFDRFERSTRPTRCSPARSSASARARYGRSPELIMALTSSGNAHADLEAYRQRVGDARVRRRRRRAAAASKTALRGLCRLQAGFDGAQFVLVARDAAERGDARASPAACARVPGRGGCARARAPRWWPRCASSSCGGAGAGARRRCATRASSSTGRRGARLSSSRTRWRVRRRRTPPCATRRSDASQAALFHKGVGGGGAAARARRLPERRGRSRREGSASRGIDFRDVAHVVQYEAATNVASTCTASGGRRATARAAPPLHLYAAEDGAAELGWHPVRRRRARATRS